MALNSSGALGFRNCLFKLGTWNPQLPEGAGGCDCLLVVTKANWDGSGAEPHLTACLFSVSCGEEKHSLLETCGKRSPSRACSFTLWSGYRSGTKLKLLACSVEDFLSQIIGVFPWKCIKVVAVFAQSLFWFVLAYPLWEMLTCVLPRSSVLKWITAMCFPWVESCTVQEESGIWLSKSSQTLTTYYEALQQY